MSNTKISLSHLALTLMTAAIISACGGGSEGNSGNTAEKQLPAPLIFTQGESTLIQIPDPNTLCKYSLHIREYNKITTIALNSDASYTEPTRSGATQYSYTCTAQGIESAQSRVGSLQQYTLHDYGYWGSMSVADFNNDGIHELLGTMSTPTGAVLVTEESLGLGPLRRAGRVYRDIRFADFDNDGNLDAIANVYSENLDKDPNYNSFIQLYWGTSNGKFVLDESFESLRYTGYGETLVVADLNNDGLLDIFIPQYQFLPARDLNIYSRNLLFRNQGGRVFEEVAITAQVAFSRQRFVEGAQALDFDADGLIDLYAGASLYRNNGNFTFTDISTAVNLPNAFEEGAKFFDHDLDGDLDFIINPTIEKPRLFININGKFAETPSNTFPNEYYMYTYGLQLGDINGDGFDDVLLGGGLDEEKRQLAPRLYLNHNGNYVRHHIANNFLGWSDLVGFSDINNDGALDILARYGSLKSITNPNLPNAHLKITVLSKGFRNQQGRTVYIKYPNSKIKAMIIDGGSGYMSNQPYELLIPNDAQATLEISIQCRDKRITFTAVNGKYIKDCN